MSAIPEKCMSRACVGASGGNNDSCLELCFGSPFSHFTNFSFIVPRCTTHTTRPDLARKLMKFAQVEPGVKDHKTNASMLGALDALAKLTEDCYGQLVNQAAGRPMNALLPCFLKKFRHPDPKVRGIAIRAVNHIIPRSCNAMDTHQQQMLQGLAFLAEDKHPHIRKGVCNMILGLLEVRAEWFEGRALQGITKYMFTVCDALLGVVVVFVHHLSFYSSIPLPR